MTSPCPAPEDTAARHARMAQRLAEVTEFDLNATLDNVGHNLPVVERLLTRFVKQYRSGEPALAHAAANDPLAAWRFASHSLRGACATIGASALPPGLAAFESALQEPADLAELSRQAALLNADLMRLVDRLAWAIEA
jgi:two-component system, sensor histidine kinase and response regulator